MNTLKKMRYVGLIGIALTCLVCGLLATPPAEASNHILCTLSFTSASSADTRTPTTSVCDWAPGAVVAMQCDQAIWYDPCVAQLVGGLKVAYPDGGNWPQRCGASVGVAESLDEKVDFTANPDTYYVELEPGEQAIAIKGVTASGTCKFGRTNRRKMQ